jgi:hypothetical protein
MTDTRKIPEWLVERVAQRELTNHDVTSEAVSQVQSSNEEILARYPVNEMVSRINRRAQVTPAPKRERVWLYVLAPVAAVLLAVISLNTEGGSPIQQPDNIIEDDVRPKGLAAKLQLYRLRGDVTEKLMPSSLARKSDRVQLTYLSAAKPYGVIVSIDGRGTVTRHLPEVGDFASALNNKGEVMLEHSYELDDAPRFECFYFVTAEQRFPLEVVLVAANIAATSKEACAPLPLAESFAQSSLLLKKVEP